MVDNSHSLEPSEPTSGAAEKPSAPTSLEELRDAVSSRLRSTESFLLNLIADFSPPAPPVPEAEELVPEAMVEEVEEASDLVSDLVVLRSAVHRLDEATDHSELLARLLEESTAFASRAALLIDPDGHSPGQGLMDRDLEVWSAIGFDRDRGSDRLAPPRAWASALDGQQSVVVDAAASETLTALLGGAPAQRAIVVPLCLRERVAGVLYADQLGDEHRFEPAGLQLLVHTAALALELVLRRERLPAATLSEPEEATTQIFEEPAPLPSAPATDQSTEEGTEESGRLAWDETETGADLAPTDSFDSDSLDSDLGAAETAAATQAFEAEGVVDTPEAPSWQAEPIPDVASPAAVEQTPEERAEEWAERPEAAASDTDGQDSPVTTHPGLTPEEPSAPAEASWKFDSEGTTGEVAVGTESPEPSKPDPFSVLSEPDLSSPAPPGLELLGGEPEAVEADDLGTAAGGGLESTFDPPPAEPSAPSDFLGGDGVEEIGLRTQALDTSAFLEAQPIPEPEPPPPTEPDPTQPASSVTTGSLVVPPTDVDGPGWAFSERSAAGGSGEDPQHDEAKRLARLLVSEIKLYNEEQIEEGRRQGNIYDRLKDDIDRSRKMYEERVDEGVRTASDYFRDELIRSLADGDAQVMGL